jgi:hypothetical protein
MKTSDRLEAYYPFDSDVLGRVEETADWQNRLSFSELATRYGVTGPQRIRPFYDNRTVEYFQLTPEGRNPEDRDVRVYHAPFGTTADKNMAMRAFRLLGAEPSKPLVVVGNPAAPGLRSGGYRRKDLSAIWNGDLRPAVRPAVKLLEYKDVNQADFIGFSFGADAAATAAQIAKDHGITANHVVATESVAVVNRNLLQLGHDFYQAVDRVDEAVKRSSSPPLFEARDDADVGDARYMLGVVRASNLALAHSLSLPLFENRVIDALNAQPELRVSVSWGDRSELAPFEVTSSLAERLQHNYGQRVGAMMLRGMDHAGGDDIDLHAAIVLQGLKV